MKAFQKCNSVTLFVVLGVVLLELYAAECRIVYPEDSDLFSCVVCGSFLVVWNMSAL